MARKDWYKSKTLWVNALATIGLIVQNSTGVEIDAQAQAGVIAIANIVLRVVTNAGLK
jgi:hypothetical protein